MNGASVLGGLLENFLFGIGSNDAFTVETNITAVEYLGHIAPFPGGPITPHRRVNFNDDYARPYSMGPDATESHNGFPRGD